jgi:hypothetical protein
MVERKLTDEEIAILRAIIKKEAHVAWLWSSLRIWATWMTIIVGGVTASWVAFKQIIRSAAGV